MVLIAALRAGTPVSAEGTVVRAPEGFALVPDAHWTPWLSTMLTTPFGPESHVIALDGDLHGFLGEHVRVAGVWDGAVVVHQISRQRPPSPERPTGYGLPLPRPAGVVGPPTELEKRLLEDGTLTDRLPHGDGTLHVATDNVELATRLLTPLYGDRLRVERAVFSQAQRRVAQAAMRDVMNLDVVCGFGSGPLDLDHVTETVHDAEVPWVTDEVADALAPVAEGLVRVSSHVTPTT